ncbi:hypothetical protein [Bacillus cereus]|uniref:hypothetical protein n=1 Tax=Bacillus cereus TaxID=1396 RepID=UPI003CFF6920
MKKLIVAGLSIGLLAGCGSTGDKNEVKDKTGQKQEVKKEDTTKKKKVVSQEDFSVYTKSIKGESFIKEAKLNNNKAEITFYDSFAAYKAAHADSTTTEEQYKQEFSTEDTIEKMFVEESARILRRFHALNSINMTLPFEGKTYNINLSRDSLNAYLGFDIESIKVADKSWEDKFVKPYVNDKTKRDEFFKKFVKVQ